MLLYNLFCPYRPAQSELRPFLLQPLDIGRPLLNAAAWREPL